jgi:phytoene dehydrogenase-like protein
MKVLVLEQSDRIGGCCSTLKRNGYRHDVGASIVENQPSPSNAYSASWGPGSTRKWSWFPAIPMFSVMYRNGERITIEKSIEATGRVIASIPPERRAALVSTSASTASDMMDVLLDSILCSPADTMGDLARMIGKTRRCSAYLPTS